MRFCPECGQPLAVPAVEQTRRILCTACGFEYFAQLKVGAGVLIEQDRRLLLLKRLQEPFTDAWNIPAGYVEADESPEQAAAREAYEETGLIVAGLELENVYFFTDDPRGNGILIVFKCRVVSGTLSGSREGCSPTYFGRETIPDRLAGGGHDQAVAHWLASVRA
jgi:ADP-ribose pyrophosphatase YjhB (NUDIX family)